MRRVWRVEALNADVEGEDFRARMKVRADAMVSVLVF